MTGVQTCALPISFRDLSERELSVLAGQWEFHRVTGSTPLYQPAFVGAVVTEGDPDMVGDLRCVGRVSLVERGVAAKVRPFGRRALVGLLPLEINDSIVPVTA